MFTTITKGALQGAHYYIHTYIHNTCTYTYYIHMRFIYPIVRKRERTKIVCSFVLGVGGGGENIDNIYSVVSIENMYCISYYYSNW